jgi:NADPH-dependent glutamate synthase beta subunit-like oxidoreductase/NAD(P)H-flavin reductase
MHTAPQSAPGLEPGIAGFSFADLQDAARLKDLYHCFADEVAREDPGLWAEWDAYRTDPGAARPAPAVSSLLVRMAGHVSRFVAQLFHVEAECQAMSEATHLHDPVFRFKVDLVRRRALPLRKNASQAALPALATDADERTVAAIVAGHADTEVALAVAACALLDREAGLPKDGAGRADAVAAIDSVARWVAAHLDDPAFAGWVSFRRPRTLDPFQLVDTERPDPAVPELAAGPERHRRRRGGFALTDARMDQRGVLSEIHYCVLCHERDKDSCSKGIRAKDGTTSQNALGIPLEGCPLDEKISEMHMLRKAGDAIGALALVTLDNPMCAGTGHRICNDCMKACIYQKQDPVDIPQAETGVLTDVLRLPWGVEIYSLLSRWNPLNVRRPYPLPFNGINILVVGLGPAGYTLSHYLLNEGFGVVGIDGLKIEPLPAERVGRPGMAPAPLRDWLSIYSGLDRRVLAGFGGVSEYGITVRWDKNFLTLLHLLLSRRDRFKAYGGIRFGGTLPIEDAWAHGFSHVAIATGAGRPTIIDMKNNLIRGVRKASDFLMALQLTGAFKRESLANLQVRLPALVIGGGLTAIDTATELMAYYPQQVEKILGRYEELAAVVGEARVRAPYDPEELAQLDEFLAHAAAIRAERARAAADGEAPDFVPLLRGWGGVSVVYRKRMVDAPAYRLNHEEIIRALEEGIGFIENLDPVEAVPDENGHVKAVVFRRAASEARPASGPADTIELPARAVLVAAGTSPNVTYEKESPGTFRLDDHQRFFLPHRVVRDADGTRRLEPDPLGFFTSYQAGGRFVSYYGDNHPRYAGNVVKAMASAKDGFRQVAALFDSELALVDPGRQDERDRAWRGLVATLDEELTAHVVGVTRLTPTIIEVIVRAPAAARHFHPGQFYRLQNFESGAVAAGIDGDRVKLVMEGIALTGAWVDRRAGLLSMIALELGVSSRLCAYLEPGQEVIVMGPTGAPTEIPRGESVLLAGGGLGNAVLFSIARALRDGGNRVIYFAGYKRGEDLFKREDIEAATDQVIWSTDTGAPIEPARPQDAHFRGNIVDCLVAYATGALGGQLVPLQGVDRMIVIGSDRMMAAVKNARGAALAPYLKRDHVAIASINSPMQCMMKEVCAQCLQKHVDPITGRETIVFSCFNQDQLMDRVDFFNLNARLRQNTVQEKLTNQWLEQALQRSGLARAVRPRTSLVASLKEEGQLPATRGTHVID